MKTLKFRPHLVKEILEGRKTMTWRLFDDKNLQVGDRLEFLNSETLEKFAEAEIIKIKEKKLGKIEDSDYEGHERYGSKEEMIKHYKNYYGDKVDLDSIVKIIKFKISMIKTIIFDIGGVITKADYKKTYSDFALRIGISPEFVINYHKEKVDDLVLGNITLEDFWEDMIKAGGNPDLDYKAIIIEEAIKNRKVNYGLLEIIKKLRNNYLVGTLTNLIPSRLIVDEKLNLYSHFDYAVLSCKEHLKKPDPKFYQLALSKASAKPEEAIFVDDKEECIIAANEIGIKTITYTYPDNNKFLEDLNKII